MHGLMATWRVRVSGLLCPQLCPNTHFYQWLAEKTEERSVNLPRTGSSECLQVPMWRTGNCTSLSYVGQEGNGTKGHFTFVFKIIRQGQHGRDMTLVIVYVEKNGAGAFIITTDICAAFIRHLHYSS